jgi:hypothetical protein
MHRCARYSQQTLATASYSCRVTFQRTFHVYERVYERNNIRRIRPWRQVQFLSSFLYKRYRSQIILQHLSGYPSVMETPNHDDLSLRLGFLSWYLSERISMRGFQTELYFFINIFFSFFSKVFGGEECCISGPVLYDPDLTNDYANTSQDTIFL